MPVESMPAARPENAGFRSTRWEVVMAARGSEMPGSGPALEELCRVYWGPVYGFVRRSGFSPSDAEDLTQEFLAWLIHAEQLRRVDPLAGRFRSFMLVRLKHFLNDWRKRGAALKRGGGRVPVPLDAISSEINESVLALTSLTPEGVFEREWSLSLVQRVLERLRDRYVARGRGALFEHLCPLLTGGETTSTYGEIAGSFGLGESAVKTAVHRLRKEFGEQLRDEIAATVSDPTEIDSEIKRLIAVTAG